MNIFDRSAIADITVWREPLPHDNSKFGARYSHKDKDVVVSHTKSVVGNMDKYRSPYASDPFESDGLWCVDVYWYSLD